MLIFFSSFTSFKIDFGRLYIAIPYITLSLNSFSSWCLINVELNYKKRGCQVFFENT
jgi:hypothetical protein